jgi:arylsulfatase A-like enzyme
MPDWTGRRAASLVALVLWLGACSQADDPERPPNVLLISIDTLRADHLGAYGYERDTSPFIDSLARRGVRFDDAVSASSWTLPAHMSLLTGRLPSSHGVNDSTDRLRRGVPTLAKLLRSAGYRTTAFVSWVFLSPGFGFGRGFDEYFDLIPPPSQRDATSRHAIKAEAFVSRVLEWLPAERSEPWFLFLHLFDPHIDYEPPLEDARVFDPDLEDVSAGHYDAIKPYIRGLDASAPAMAEADAERVRALYDGEIRYVDRQLARLFEALGERGMLDDTLVVLTADHGEEFGEHGSMEGHGWTLYDEVLHVPLILVLPDAHQAGRSIAGQVRTIDVVPTVLALTGVPPPEGLDGRSLVPRLEGLPPPDDAIAFSQISRNNRMWSARTGRHKLIYTHDTKLNKWGVPVRAGHELYDLEQDPGEQRDIFDEQSPVARALWSELQAFIEASRDARSGAGEEPGGEERPVLSPAQRERLRGLGYVE